MLREIPKSNRELAHRLLQCLTVAIRPLRVEELAEVLAIEFDPSGIPILNEDLRWEDQEKAVLSACSGLITVVDDHFSRVVQFANLSVKEFLTSHRLADSEIDAFRHYHIRLESAHRIMAQACLSVLLRLDTDVDEASITNFPLARYAAHNFGDHAEFGDVLSHIQQGVDILLDADKPHFAAWVWLHDGIQSAWPPRRPKATPLYIVAEFGYLSLVRYLISKSPEDISRGGECGTPLHAAVREGHTDVAKLLLGHLVDVDVQDFEGRTALHVAVDKRLLDGIRLLLGHGADINARDINGQTPLYRIVKSVAIIPEDRGFDVAKLLLEQGADPDVKDSDDSTPLHAASYYGNVKIAHLLLDHGASVHARNKKGQTPLHEAVYTARDYGAGCHFDAMQLLLMHGTDVDTLDNDHSSPLHVASKYGRIRATRLLLQNGANIHPRNHEGRTPLQVAQTEGHEEFTRLLSEYLQ